MLGSKTFGALVAATLVSVTPPVAHADSTPTDPQYISLYNGGAYTIKTVTVKWKHGSSKDQKRYTSNFAYFEAFCVDLSQVKSSSGEAIPEGAEVWLTADIEGGDSSSCRKDTRHYYQNSGKTWNLIMSGTTLNNNNCKNSDLNYEPTEIYAGNSKACSDTN